MSLEIRNMVESDSQAVLEMMRVFYDSPAVFHTASDDVLKRDIADCVSDMPYVSGYIFEVDGVLAGYAMTAICYTTEYGGICIWLEDLYLKPEYRGQDIPSQFFRYIEEQHPEAVRFKLEVEKENERAIAVYKKNGYGISPYFEMTKEMITD